MLYNGMREYERLLEGKGYVCGAKISEEIRSHQKTPNISDFIQEGLS